MHTTLSLFSKALRFPLTSKRGNKDFYKGTRAGNILRRKRLGAISRIGEVLKSVTPNGKVVDRVEYRRVMHIDESKVPSFVVPPGLAETPLKPYVRATKNPTSHVGTPLLHTGYYSPVHDPVNATDKQKSLNQSYKALGGDGAADAEGESSTGPAHVSLGPRGMTPEVYSKLAKMIWTRRIVGGEEELNDALRKAKKVNVKSGSA